jgi:hypothetical protein
MGHYLNVVKLLGRTCELAPCRQDKEAVIYTEDQLEWVEKYYERKNVACYRQLVIKKKRSEKIGKTEEPCKD